MAGTFLGKDSVELAVVTRGGFIESRHVGSAAVVDANGELLLSLGDVRAPIFPRSTLKFVQALASLEAGAPLDGEHLAVACASHVGTPLHVALVRDILGRAGLDESALQCPATWPADRASRDSLIRSGEPSARVFMECSGKHAGFLAACSAAGWPVENYLHPDHPLQKLVRESLARFAGEQISVTAVDGCGAPVYAVSLAGMARAMSRFATSQSSSPFGIFRNAAKIWQATLKHPWTIAGHGRPDSVVIEELGVLAKTGAEGVLVLVAPDGTSVAIKSLDGSSRANMLPGLQLLVAAGSIDAARAEAVLPKLRLAISGGGQTVGAIMLGSDIPTVIERD
ncbi:asparaginase [Gulosibacter molinativorax]|uniref:Asparaginase n=1 Tax=Gulosibacter molinativorax TaxID=256821 RepID=A0ABT7C3P3_9MICO|nr:asparaginase [Gulosibacter molinativorax]MDJ1369864.1 asparaginase [Gulosibacter molinativorax]QUY61829.1 Asparaginase II [Gulosibacter molinativorax]